MTNVIWLLLGLLIAGAAFFVYDRQKPRDTQYRVVVKFAHGIKTTLVLNETQYEQFRAWINHPDGIYEIGDDANMVTLDRSYVVSVETRKR